MIINDLDVTLHGVKLQIIHTTIFRVKRLNNRTLNITYFCPPYPSTESKQVNTYVNKPIEVYVDIIK